MKKTNKRVKKGEEKENIVSKSNKLVDHYFL